MNINDNSIIVAYFMVRDVDCGVIGKKYPNVFGFPFELGQTYRRGEGLLFFPPFAPSGWTVCHTKLFHFCFLLWLFYCAAGNIRLSPVLLDES